VRKNGKRKAKPLPAVLSEDEQMRIVGVLESASTPGRLRNLAVVRIFLNTGIRCSELINLTIRDIDWTTGDFMVRQGKGGKDRALALNDDDLALLKSYLSSSGILSSSGNRLVFTSLDGSKPLCGRWLRRWVKRLGEKAGINKNLHPHLFRHTLACDLLRATNSLKVVQDTLGHENIATTTVYARLVNGEVKQALKNLRNGGPH
jgi:site-specific recombinase XerD